MTTIRLINILLIIITLNLSSCKIVEIIFDGNKKAKARSEQMVRELQEARERVYTQVRLVKRSALSQPKKDSLKAEYNEASNSFGKVYQNIINGVDSSLINQGKCIVFNYKRVLLPHELDLKKSSTLADNFIKDSNKALNAGGAAAGQLITGTVILGIIKQLAKERIMVCKSDIDKLKYKSWEDVN